jgi:hypothetical protein
MQISASIISENIILLNMKKLSLLMLLFALIAGAALGAPSREYYELRMNI